MRRWVKWTLAGFVGAIVLFLILAGVGGYYVFRHLETGQTTEAVILKEFDAVRARFPERPPLVEIVNPQAGDVRINKLTHPEGREATTLHVLTWSRSEDGEKFQTDVPLWLMRFSSVNILSRLGITPSKYRLVVHDIERYGPGIVADYRRPGHSHVLIWAE
jgi:hypothetical protein